MNFAKKKAISDSYGKYWNQVKNNVDENGWFYYRSIEYLTEKKNYSITHYVDCDNDIFSNSVRPKSLQGIENNNGWIRIESEEDLPKEPIECWFIHYERIYSGAFGGRMFGSGATLAGWKTVSHYQPIVKPEKHIY